MSPHEKWIYLHWLELGYKIRWPIICHLKVGWWCRRICHLLASVSTPWWWCCICHHVGHGCHHICCELVKLSGAFWAWTVLEPALVHWAEFTVHMMAVLCTAVLQLEVLQALFFGCTTLKNCSKYLPGLLTGTLENGIFYGSFFKYVTNRYTSYHQLIIKIYHNL